MRAALAAVVAVAAVPFAASAAFAAPDSTAAPASGRGIVVGSKAFPESWILGEAVVRLAREVGHAAEHRQSLGGTEIVYQGLRSGQIDVYPEYTGTIAEVLLHRPGATLDTMRAVLATDGIAVSAPLGFNDGYALAVLRATADRLGLRTLSDLAGHPELRFGLTHEFLGRADGWPGLAERYAFHPRVVRGIQHELAYTALADGGIDVTDVYTTDAQIARLDLVALEDDRGYFPRYDAVLLYRRDLERRAPQALRAMRRLEGAIDEPRMTRANARVVIGKATATAAAETLLAETIGTRASTPAGPSLVLRVGGHVAQHLRLVLLSLAAAVLVGVPMGVASARWPRLAGPLLSVTGLLQTIPSLALLAFLIPIMGIGAAPALVALFLYGLLPIVRNTHTGLVTIPPALTESALALGLSARARLWSVDLPLASPAILAGIKTSAIINVGTATLAALIGAGGLGEPILAGIQLRRHDLILEGAIPAAALALLVQAVFDVIEPWIVPRGLRLRGDDAGR